MDKELKSILKKIDVFENQECMINDRPKQMNEYRILLVPNGKLDTYLKDLISSTETKRQKK